MRTVTQMAAQKTHRLTGRYFPAYRSGGVPAELTISSNMLSLSIEGALNDTLPEVTDISSKVGNIPRRISFSDGSVFETTDNDAVDAVFDLSNRFSTRFFALEKLGKWTIVIAVACVLVVYGVYAFGLPLAARVAAWATPSVLATAIDRGSMQTLDRLVFDE